MQLRKLRASCVLTKLSRCQKILQAFFIETKWFNLSDFRTGQFIALGLFHRIEIVWTQIYLRPTLLLALLR